MGAGALAGDKSLKRKAKVDQAIGKTKRTVKMLLDKAKDELGQRDERR